MAKRIVLAVVAVFLAWSVMDFLIHGMLLKSTYETTAELWRPMEEMKMGLMYGVTLIYTGGFVLIYALLIKPKSLAAGLGYGALFGVVSGISMGFGSYCYMPISLMLASVWFAGSLVESIVAGIITAAIVKAEVPNTNPEN